MDRTAHNETCKLFLPSYVVASVKAAMELYAATDSPARLVGWATHKSNRSESNQVYMTTEHGGCYLCSMGALRKAHPRKRSAYPVYIEGDYPGSHHRLFTANLAVRVA